MGEPAFLHVDFNLIAFGTIISMKIYEVLIVLNHLQKNIICVIFVFEL